MGDRDKPNLFVCQTGRAIALAVGVNPHGLVECDFDNVSEGRWSCCGIPTSMNHTGYPDECHCRWLSQSAVIIAHLESGTEGDSLKGTMSLWCPPADAGTEHPHYWFISSVCACLCVWVYEREKCIIYIHGCCYCMSHSNILSVDCKHSMSNLVCVYIIC